jgi:integrase
MSEPKARAWGAIRKPRNGHGTYVVRFAHDGLTYDRGGFTTWGAADKARRRARTLIEAGTPIEGVLSACFGDFLGAELTFRDAAPSYLAFAKPRKRPSTFAADVSRLRVASLAPWAGKRLGKITSADLLAWIADREARGSLKSKAKDKDGKPIIVPLKVGAINRDLAIVGALFAWAKVMKYVESNPAREIERRSEKGNGREVYLTGPEARALIDACSPVLRPAVVLALSTGMRRGELLGLRWRSVDLARKEIRVEAETDKAGRGRVVQMTTETCDLLVAMKSNRPRPALDASDPVLTVANGEPLPPSAVRSMFERTVAACEGIPLAKRSALVFHGLRHSAASLMVAEGVPLLDVARILGHSTLAVTMKYAHFAPESGRTAIDRLGAALAVAPAKAEKPIEAVA